MKITNYLSVFLVICVILITLTNTSVHSTSVMQNEYSNYNRNIDLATDEGLENLIEVAEIDKFNLNLEECSEHFFNSLYASFGAMDSPSLQARLNVSVPALVAIGEDGCYIMYQTLQHDKFSTQWTNKIPYVYDAGAFTVNFTMSRDVQLIIDGCDTVFEGNIFTLLEKYPIQSEDDGEGSNEPDENNTILHSVLDGSELLEESIFEAQRRTTITQTILQQLSYYVNRHNHLADEFGLSYEFRLPDSSADSVVRAVDDVSLLVMFQNYPYNSGNKEVYSRFTVSGSRIHKSRLYYVSMGNDNKKYYHKETCALKGGSLVTYKTPKECAKVGAYPCRLCRP